MYRYAAGGVPPRHRRRTRLVDEQLAALPEGFTGIAPQIAGLTDTDRSTFTLRGAAADVISDLDGREIDRAHLCGLSLGAPRVLMAMQSALMRVLPARVVAPDGTHRTRRSCTHSPASCTHQRSDACAVWPEGPRESARRPHACSGHAARTVVRHRR